MYRIAVVLFLLVWASACAELEPTAALKPTATPWLDREACLNLNEIVDDWLAGVNSGGVDAAEADRFFSDLKEIRDRLDIGSDARESMNEFFALADSNRQVSDDEFERKFNAFLIACELSPLPTVAPETMYKPAPTSTPEPTVRPTPTPTSTPKPTATPKPEPTATSRWQVCTNFQDEMSAQDYDAQTKALSEAGQALGVSSGLSRRARFDAINEFCQNLGNLMPDIVAYALKVGGHPANKGNGYPSVSPKGYLREARYYVQEITSYNRDPEKFGRTSFLDLQCAVKPVLETQLLNLPGLCDGPIAIPSGMSAVHPEYLAEKRILANAVVNFIHAVQLLNNATEVQASEQRKRELFNAADAVETAWYSFMFEHNRLMSVYTRE